MNDLLKKAELCIQNGQCDEAVEILCQEGVPDSKAAFELIALAHHKRRATRGDVYTAATFAQRALDQGSDHGLMPAIVADAKRHDNEEGPHLIPKEYALGGWDEKREAVEAPLSTCALSKLNGVADAPKDFDWIGKNIPCQKACPASTDIPGYLGKIYNGEHEEAYKINLRDNVFPAVLGRVCARPCESDCRHGREGLGEPVAICFSKRSAADFKTQDLVVMDPLFEKSGKHIAVVGGGPAGLASARQLALLGHDVTVYEKHHTAGGMMNQGIPVFRLPRDIIAREIKQITELGVEIICNTEIGKTITVTDLVAKYDAVVVAAGTLLPNILNLPGKELTGIRHGLDFLLEVNDTGSADIGKEVVVIGGGFTAMDCARAAKRLGANVRVCYRRTADEMLVTPGELDELDHEDIGMEYMVSPVAYSGENGSIETLQFIRTELGEPDESGRRRPVEIKGSEFSVPVDSVLLATGQFPDRSWIDEELEEGHEKVFLAGDFANGASSLIQAIGHAKDTVRDVDQFVMGKERVKDVIKIEDVVDTGRIREMDFVDRQPMPGLELAKRDLEGEVELGFNPETSIDEAQRCYQCHYKFEIDSDKCIFCEWCVKAKPQPECIVKIKKLNHDADGRVISWDLAETADEVTQVWINQDDCIRCGACVAACPVDAISVQKVSLCSQKV